MTTARARPGLVAVVATIVTICAPARGWAQVRENIDFSGQAYVESNKTFPTGRILDPGPYFNLFASGQYGSGSDHLTATAIIGVPVTGHDAVTLNKVNLNLCASHAGSAMGAQLCTTHYFNPTGRAFNDLYAVISRGNFGMQLGDTNLEDGDGPYVELFVRGQTRLGAGGSVGWRITAAHSHHPDVAYGSILVELARADGLFLNIHVYTQEGYSRPDVTLRAGLRF